MVDDRPHGDAVWLTVDRGNSTLDCMLVGGGGADTRARVGGGREAFREFLGGRRPTAAAAVSVVAGSLDELAAELAACGVTLRAAGRDLPCPLRSRYRTPATLGADRWVAAVAARARFGSAVVVDCGSAVTVDAVTAEGVFLGGAIAPGVRALARGLAGAAPALPPAALETAAFELPPTTTVDAVAAGVRLGFVGLVEGLVRRIAAAAGLEDAPVVLTGGDAPLVLAHAERHFEPVDDLVHAGLRCLLRDSRS